MYNAAHTGVWGSRKGMVYGQSQREHERVRQMQQDKDAKQRQAVR